MLGIDFGGKTESGWQVRTHLQFFRQVLVVWTGEAARVVRVDGIQIDFKM